MESMKAEIRSRVPPVAAAVVDDEARVDGVGVVEWKDSIEFETVEAVAVVVVVDGAAVVMMGTTPMVAVV